MQVMVALYGKMSISSKYSKIVIAYIIEYNFHQFFLNKFFKKVITLISYENLYIQKNIEHNYQIYNIYQKKLNKYLIISPILR